MKDTLTALVITIILSASILIAVKLIGADRISGLYGLLGAILFNVNLIVQKLNSKK